MNRHSRFELVITATGATVCGDTMEEVYGNLPPDFLSPGPTMKTQCRFTLENNGIEDVKLPDIKDGGVDNFLDAFFMALEMKLVATWKWYDSLYGDCWRYDPFKNDVVPRIALVKAMGIERPRSDGWKVGLEKSHENRRNNPELASEIARKAGKASAALMTPERKKEIGKQRMNGLMRKYRSMTQEEWDARNKKIRETKARNRQAKLEAAINAQLKQEQQEEEK